HDEGIEDAAVIAQVAASATHAAEQFVRSKPGLALRRARQVFYERSFELELCGARLTGQIDLLIHARDGRFLVVDYKTDGGVIDVAGARQLATRMGYREQ